MKILCIVQARMGSERLQGKVIKPILKKPMILHTLDRLKKSKYINEIVLATSTEAKEEPLINVVTGAGYEVFRGSEKNVLERYKMASDKYNGDIIIRVTGDCPLIDPIIVDNVVTYFLMNDFDYVRLDVPDSFVRGFDIEIFSKAALNRVYNEISVGNSSEENNMYREHVTLYIYRHPEIFRIGYVKGFGKYNKNYRLCVDTVEDFTLVEKIYEHFNNDFVYSKEIITFLDDNPSLSDINMHIKQK